MDSKIKSTCEIADRLSRGQHLIKKRTKNVLPTDLPFFSLRNWKQTILVFVPDHYSRFNTLLTLSGSVDPLTVQIIHNAILHNRHKIVNLKNMYRNINKIKEHRQGETK